MSVIVIIPENLKGNWLKNLILEYNFTKVKIFVLKSKPTPKRYRSFFHLDKLLFKGAKSLDSIDTQLKFHYVSKVSEIQVNESITDVFNFTHTIIKNNQIKQYQFFVNNSNLIFNSIINSTILPVYKKVQLKIKEGENEFKTTVRFDPISASKNLDLVLSVFLSLIKNNLKDLKRLKNEEFKTSSINSKSVYDYSIRFLKKIIDYKFFLDQWIIAFQFTSQNKIEPFSFKNTYKIIPPNDRFWADPIVIFENDIYYVFIEELLYSNNKGHISVFEINKEGKTTTPIKIIENDYHMSYPFVFKYNDEYYMIPETSHNSTIDLYKAKNFPYEWEFEKTIMDNIKATDTTLLYHNKRWWMFTSIKEFENGTYDNVVSVFNSDSPISSNWKRQINKTIKNEVENSRQGGPFFIDDNNLYRISQNGSNTYGYGYNVNKIIELSESSYEEETIYNYTPIEKEIIGVHTFNKVEGIQVYDVLKRIRSF